MNLIKVLIILSISNVSFSQKVENDYLPLNLDSSLIKLIDNKKDTSILLLDFNLRDTVENKTVYFGSGFLSKMNISSFELKIEQFLIDSLNNYYKFADILILKDTDGYALKMVFDCTLELSNQPKDELSQIFLKFFKTKEDRYLLELLDFINENPDSIDLVQYGNIIYFLNQNNFIKRSKKGKYKPNKSLEFVRYLRFKKQ